MAAGTIISGSHIQSNLNGFVMESVQIVTNAVGETGVTYDSNVGIIREVFVTGNEDGKVGPYTAVWSGNRITVKSLADTGDAATVGLLILGF